MTTITREEAEKLAVKWIKKLDDYYNMGSVPYEELKKDGFEYCNFGTGKSAYTCSKDVRFQKITSRYYLNGTYLTIGCANRSYGKGNMYQGWAIAIK